MRTADTATRTERDSFGPIDVPAERLWGAQTQRSLQNFDISGERQPAEIIHALALVKRASATVNPALGPQDQAKAGTRRSFRSWSGRPDRARRPT